MIFQSSCLSKRWEGRTIFHLTKNDNIEQCIDKKCRISDSFHFKTFVEALKVLDNIVEPVEQNKNIKVRRYDKKINYESNGTLHFNSNRIFRERELKRLLGNGSHVRSFIVDEGDGKLQIQEILDNGILVIYSFATHKKITTFAPTSDRISFLYFSVGEFPPEWLIEKSEENTRKGYNLLFDC